MNVYEEAIEVIRERGWCQGHLKEQDGSVCAMGALGIAAHGNVYAGYKEYARSYLVLTDVLRDLGYDVNEDGMYHPIAAWNDAPERSVEDVVLALKHAAAEVDR